jgi:poly(ADP-ribose) glycohydrolase ARH3
MHDLASRFRGALLGGAVGDALGRPVEGWPRAAIRARYGVLRDFQPPGGRYTDDTQLTICVAESLLAGDGTLDPADLARRFVAMSESPRGWGMATTAAVGRLAAGVPWQSAGEHSAGNGAAMRVAPVGLAHIDDVGALRRNAALSATLTHTDPRAVASAVAQAALAAWCARRPPGPLVPAEAVDAVAATLAPVAGSASLVERLGAVLPLLGTEPGPALAALGTSGFVLETLPAAVWCFLRSPDDAEEVIVTAANAGGDTDTLAAMAGTLAGAHVGDAALPERWLEGLEDRDRLMDLADRLYGLVAGRA